MIEEKPRIAIPEPTSKDSAYNQRSLPQYLRAVELAGGEGVAIPLASTLSEQTALLASCSGILLPGSGADIDPERYGERPIPECSARDEARETADELLLKDAFAQGKPILGICFGLQSLNVWRGGSLIQDLPHAFRQGTSVPGMLLNHQPGREVQNAHTVSVAPDSLLARSLAVDGNQTPSMLEVNSSHHQAIGRPAADLGIAAVSPQDGVIEALEGLDPEQFVVAVQWHPERSYEHSAASRALFTAFVAAAIAWNSGPESEQP